MPETPMPERTLEVRVAALEKILTELLKITAEDGTREATIRADRHAAAIQQLNPRY